MTAAANTMNDQNQECPQAKWFGLINDTVIPLPRRRIPASVLRTQARVPDEHILLRDHNSPQDAVIDGTCEVDLGQGNVFYSRSGKPCPGGSPTCAQPPKLAFALDDRAEVTIRPDQTGRSLRELFGVSEHRVLLRDFESPQDLVIGDNDAVLFGDGPVFISQAARHLCINIEGKVYPWNEPTISTAQIRALGHLPPDQPVVCEDADGQERTLREDEVIELKPGCRVGRAPKYKRGSW